MLEYITDTWLIYSMVIGSIVAIAFAYIKKKRAR
ncbi:EYxxD motif small membrane protein [Guptibacillus hwajinpoensis]